MTPPKKDCMGQDIDTVFIDGKTANGSWAYMTELTHSMIGVGLGIGKGQKYVKQPDGRWLKIG